VILKKLLSYTETADAVVIKTFMQAKQSMPQAEALFSHVLNAQHIWISRINQMDNRFNRFDIHPVSMFNTLHQEISGQLNQILDTSELDKIISYSTFSGDKFDSTLEDILLHVVNHSTYHRAQIATYFKQNNVKPPETDFITYQRAGFL
jgi:uncharacterized damage-inducible protein DinB